MSQTDSSDSYPLPRDNAETIRLNEQHKCLVGAFGFHIHPSIPVAKEEHDFRVADIACGSGTEGGYGKDFECQLDIVAVRLLHISIAGAQWTRAVQNAIALLKPGGYLQWIDWDLHSARLVQSRPMLEHTAIDQLLGLFKQFLGALDTGATARLPEQMREGGLVDVKSELFALDADAIWREYFLMTITTVMPDAVAKRIGQLPAGAANGKDWAKMKTTAQEEGKQEGLWVRTEMWCHAGKKPL
ncbi:hypothetical protein LTR12_017887 [Friedmanniomyces endolithicus]|nr:hypothetical protein LTR12_017887 [Friedmanniomyces endolithicus]